MTERKKERKKHGEEEKAKTKSFPKGKAQYGQEAIAGQECP
jgi:hypothetical protein